jgi:rhodanese-related sulfurtransferase
MLALMHTEVDLPGLDALLASGAQLVEVLPRNEYDEEHLPGAISLPLKEIDASTVAGLDRRRAVAVYCWDSL